MKMKIIFLLISIVFLSIHNASANAPTSSPFKKMDEAADEILQMTKMDHYDEAKRLLKSFSKEFTDDTFKNRLFTLDEWNILSLAQKEALVAVSNNKILPDEKIQDVTRFRLVVDALNSKYQPLWTEMQQPIMDALNQVKQAQINGSFDDFQLALNTFLSQYSIIEPSLRVDIPVTQLQSLNAKISFVDKYRIKMLKNGSEQAELNKLGDDLQSLFDEMAQDETDPSLWWVIISTGSIIIFTLSYVGWRKYKGQKHDKTRKEHND
jgi:sporulation protein YpjB